jgi:hypothetical protein
MVSGQLVAIFFARREDLAHGGTGILPMRTAKMAVPRLGCGPAALDHYFAIFFESCEDFARHVGASGARPGAEGGSALHVWLRLRRVVRSVVKSFSGCSRAALCALW